MRTFLRAVSQNDGMYYLRIKRRPPLWMVSIDVCQNDYGLRTLSRYYYYFILSKQYLQPTKGKRMIKEIDEYKLPNAANYKHKYINMRKRKEWNRKNQDDDHFVMQCKFVWTCLMLFECCSIVIVQWQWDESVFFFT